MHWVAFAVCAAAGLVLQTTIGPQLAIAGAKPDWMFVLVVVFALYAPRRDAYVAGWVLGLLTDLMSIERLGVFSITYCLAAVAVNAVRDLVFLKSAVTHLVITLLAGAVVQLALAAYRIAVYPDVAHAVWGYWLETAGTVAYTALWAPPVAHLVLKASPWLGLHTSRYSHRPPMRWRADRV